MRFTQISSHYILLIIPVKDVGIIQGIPPICIYSLILLIMLYQACDGYSKADLL